MSLGARILMGLIMTVNMGSDYLYLWEITLVLIKITWF